MTLAIRKRKTQARRTENQGSGRHPLLKLGSVHLGVWQYIKANPGVTAGDIVKQFGCDRNRISELVKHGLVRYEGTKNKRRYFVNEGMETGKGRDKVETEITIYVNDYGEFSMAAKLVRQMAGSTEANPRPVLRKRLAFFVPREDEPIACHEGFVQMSAPDGEAIGSAPPTLDRGGEIIDVDYEEVG